MRKFFYENFTEFLKNEGIVKVNFILKDNEDLNRKSLEDKVFIQLGLIRDFHNISCGFNGYLKTRINNDTCKLIEDFKVQTKKLRKSLDKIKEIDKPNEVEQFIYLQGPAILKRAENVLKHIENNNYIELIERSMRNVEICLSDVDFDNLSKGDKLEIVNFSDIAYNMVEMDAYYLLSKLKRRGYKLDFERCTREFCNLENLDQYSVNFILALISYPYEFMNMYDKYKRNKKNWTSAEYIRRLNNAIRDDGDSLIDEVMYDRGKI